MKLALASYDRRLLIVEYDMNLHLFTHIFYFLRKTNKTQHLLLSHSNRLIADSLVVFIQEGIPLEVHYSYRKQKS